MDAGSAKAWGRRDLMGAILFLALAASWLGLAGCQAARMDLSPALKATNEMPVSGREFLGPDRDIAFGPYRTVGMRRGWTDSQAWGLTWRNTDWGQLEARQQYQFTLQAPARPPALCQCAVNVDRSFLRSAWGRLSVEGDVSGSSSLVCTISPGSGEPVWQLLLSRVSGEPVFNGLLGNGVKGFQVAGTRRLQGTTIPLGEASGYEFRQEGNPVGAVEVLNEGAVWLAPGIGPENAQGLAAAAAALLLHMEIGRR